MEFIRDQIQLDQKNRLHIPMDLMKMASIEPNSKVAISYDTVDDVIIIRRQNALEEAIENEKKSKKNKRIGF